MEKADFLTNKEMVRIRIYLERLAKCYTKDSRLQFRLPNKFWQSLSCKERQNYNQAMKDNDSQITQIENTINKLLKWERQADLGLAYDRRTDLWIDDTIPEK